MKKHLIFKDAKSDKFWSIETLGASFKVTYGKAGTDGQTSTKEFDTEEKCVKEAEKLINEKLKKGYVVSTQIADKADNLLPQIVETNSGVGARLMSKKLRYEMQDDDVTENYLFTITQDRGLKVHYDRQGASNDDLLFTENAIVSAKKHIELSQGNATSNGDDLPDKITSLLPPFLVSRTVLKELNQKGRSKFMFPWSYDEAESTKITVRERQKINIHIDGEDTEVPILICTGSNDDCDDITLWIVDDSEWPIILIHNWDDDFFWKFVEAGTALTAEMPTYRHVNENLRLLPEPEVPAGIWKALQFPITVKTGIHGNFILGPSESLYEIDIQTEDLRNDRKGFYYSKAIGLTTASNDYDPEGVLVWIPSIKMFGSWDHDHLNLFVFKDASIKDILSNAAFYLTTQWGSEEDEACDVLKLEGYFDFVPQNLDKNIISIFENHPDERSDIIKKWNPVLSKYKSLREEFSSILVRYARHFNNEIIEGRFEKVKMELKDAQSFFTELLGKNGLEKEFSKLDECTSFLNETIFIKEFEAACKSENLDSIIPFIDRLKEIASKGKRDNLIAYLYNAFNGFLKARKLTEAKMLLQNYLSQIPLIGHTSIIVKGGATGVTSPLRESFTSDAVVLSIFMKDDEVLRMAEKLLPDHITSSALSFNLACLYAVKKEKKRMIHFISVSLNLGKNKEQFMNDSDFDGFKTDADFLDAIENKKSLKYFVLERENNDNHPLLACDDNWEKLAEGETAKLRLGRPIPKKYEMVDYHSLPQSVFSDRIKEILEPYLSERVKLVQATVTTPKNKVFSYWILNTHLDVIDCIDFEKSKAKVDASGVCDLMKKLVLDMEKLSEIPEYRRQVFCVLGHQYFDIVSEEVAQVLSNANVVGLRLIPVEEWTDGV